MQNLIESNICQYADDKTCYEHFPASKMNQYVTKPETIMSDMLNYAKSKNMIFGLTILSKFLHRVLGTTFEFS